MNSPKLKKFLRKSLIIVVRMYIIICVILYFFQDSLIFFPQPTLVDILSPNIQSLMIPTDGIMLEGYIERSFGTGSVLYFPGNAEEVSPFVGSTAYSGNLIAFNYRGYGKSTGKPSEEALFHDALVIYDTLVASGFIDPKYTIIIGRSLGTGVASYLASKRPSSGLVLITPFDSLESVAQEKYAIFPIPILLKHRFLSTSYLKNFHGRSLIIS